MDASTQHSPRIERIRFNDENGDITLLVWNLKPKITVTQVKEIMAFNGIKHLMGVLLNENEKCSYAVCIFATPTDAFRALNMKFLVVPDPSDPCPRIVKRCANFNLPLYICENLMNHHFPLRWSHQISISPIKDNENRCKTCTLVVRILIDGKYAVHSKEQVELQEEEEELSTSLKMSISNGFRNALAKMDLEVNLDHPLKNSFFISKALMNESIQNNVET